MLAFTKIALGLPILAISLFGLSAARTADITIDQMPAQLENPLCAERIATGIAGQGIRLSARSREGLPTCSARYQGNEFRLTAGNNL
jgi:hypothetical protein